MKPTDQIKIDSIDLGVGDGAYQTCPFCNSNDKGSFYVSRNDKGLLYICYRASCGESGFIPSMSSNIGKVREKRFTPKYFTARTENIDAHLSKWIEDKYHIKVEDTEWLKMCYENRLVFPTKTNEGFVWGVVTKSIDGSTPKTILYVESEFKPKIHIPHPIESPIVYVVEDIISAERIPNSVALLGTELTDYAVNYLLSLGVRQLRLALDFDALIKAHKIKNKYQLAFPEGIKIMLWPSRVDPKDMTQDELKEIFL